MASAFDPTGLRNPVFSLPGISVRDPAAIWHEGTCYLYYTREITPENGATSWDIGLVTTQDFRHFSEDRTITPDGYASPGNVVHDGTRFVMPIQSYPWPAEIALIFSDDLLSWSDPVHIVPADSGPAWCPRHGPIDGWLTRYEGRWYCYWVNFLLNTDHRAFGVHVSDSLVTWENITPHQPIIDGSAYDHNGGVENCSILQSEGRWHFFASVGMDPQHLAHVSSLQDPLTWPALTPDTEVALTPAPWCGYHQSAVFVDDWRDVCGRYAMIYHGIGTRIGLAQFGLAFSDDLWEWKALEG